MKITIKTTKLQYLLNRVGKCSSNNKMLPLTCMTCLMTDGNGNLLAITTSINDYCKALIDCNKDDSFNVTVSNDIFYRLVAKTTSENITLEVVDHHLLVTGNGKYTVDLPVDENGDLIKFNLPVYHVVDEKGVLTASALAIVSKTNKANLSNSLAEPCYTGYYIGEKILTSDRSVICATNEYVFDTPILINDRVMSILDTDVKIGLNDTNEVIFFGDDYTVYTKSMESIEDFNAEAIENLIDTSLDFKCNIKKQDLLTVLDRLSLFINEFDKNCLAISLASDSLTLSNIKLNSSETIPVQANGSYKFNVDIEMFKKQVSVIDKDVFELQYGSDMFIKLITDKVVEIIPLLVE